MTPRAILEAGGKFLIDWILSKFPFASSMRGHNIDIISIICQSISTNRGVKNRYRYRFSFLCRIWFRKYLTHTSGRVHYIIVCFWAQLIYTQKAPLPPKHTYYIAVLANYIQWEIISQIYLTLNYRSHKMCCIFIGSLK